MTIVCVMCCGWYAGGIYWDRPYGLKIAKWDEHKFSPRDDEDAFSHIGIINQCPNTCLITHQHFREISQVIASCEAADYRDASMFQTYKPAQNAHAPNNLVNAADMILIHYKGGMKNHIQKNFPNGKNPTQRHNFLATPMLYGKDGKSGDDPTNPCEKHPIIAYHLSKILFETGKPVLVIGSGSGGEVVGLLRAGFNVVAVEIDHAQNVALRARLMAEAEVLEDNKKKMELFYQQAQKDYARWQMHLSNAQLDELWPDLKVGKDEKKQLEAREPEPVELPPISGNCVICDCDLNGAESEWCPLCFKVARHKLCLVKCPSGEHQFCGDTCVSKCVCVLPPVDVSDA